MEETRYEKLRLWMTLHRITLVELGNRLDITPQSVGTLLAKDRMPTERHKQLLSLGFPVDLLPIPLDIPRGRRPQVPHFPGLDEKNQNEKEERSNV